MRGFVLSSGLRLGFGFRVSGFGFRVQGAGFRETMGLDLYQWAVLEGFRV